MTANRFSQAQPIALHSILQRFLPGAGIALFLITLMIYSVDQPDPSWPAHWRIRPLILTPLIAGFGAASTCLLDKIITHNRWKRILRIFLSCLIYIVWLWLGMVLGLDGTLWD